MKHSPQAGVLLALAIILTSITLKLTPVILLFIIVVVLAGGCSKK